MPEPQVVRLKTIRMKGVSTSLRPVKKRVFTDDEWNYLNTLETTELLRRIEQGSQLVRLLYHPAILNMTQSEADKVSSNLRYQMDAIWTIIRSRNNG